MRILRIYPILESRGHTEALRQEIVSKLRSIGSYLDRQSKVDYRHCRWSYLCEACYSQWLAKRKPREWRTPTMVEQEFYRDAHKPLFSITSPILKPKHIPHIKRTCACNGFEAGCRVSPHIVPVDSLPIDSDLVGILEYRRQLRFELVGLPYHKRNGIPFYILP